MNQIRIENFLYPYVRFFNAATNVKNVDFYIGNSLAASNVTFGEFSPYIKIMKGKQEIKITESGNRDKLIASLMIIFSDGEVYTVAAVDVNDSVIAYGINEPTLRENLNLGHVRICHLSPNAGEVDVEANDYDILEEIKFLELSNYIAITPGKYDFKIKDSGNEDVFLNVTSQIMKPGVYNTLYIIGLANESPKLQGVLSVDAASYNGYYL